MSEETSKKKENPIIRTDDVSVLSAQAKALGLSFLPKAPKEIDKTLFALISEDTTKMYRMVPFRQEGDTICIAMVNPQNLEALNVLRFLSEKEHKNIKIYLASEKTFSDIMQYYTGTDMALKKAIVSLKEESEDIAEIKKEKKSNQGVETFQDTPIAKLVDVIVRHALDGSASDIHIEPIDESFRVRFRVDGILRSQLVFPLEVGRAVISRIKILSNLKIDEKRKPQDGRFRFESEDGRVVDLRVSSLPVLDGEKIAMRMLDKSTGLSDIEKLGLCGRNRSILEEAIHKPFGIILITGPTGSGKSTTLYAFLQILNKEERNIITLEDPIEYYIEGVNQSQIKPEIDYTFASGLRSILRQDPNVIMVGEVRDNETAELVIHAALTGHLILSTLHTNDAIGAIPRLIDMGVEFFLLASSLEAVAAQRLVRRICEDCRVEFPLTEFQKNHIQELFNAINPKEVADYGLDPKQPIIFYQGKGCENCNQSGYRGRVAIYEVIAVNDELRDMIFDHKVNETEIQKAAARQGMMNMKQDGILKALKGITTLAEIELVTEGKLLVDAE